MQMAYFVNCSMYVDMIIIIAFCKTSITKGKSFYEMDILLDVCITSFTRCSID